MKVLATVFAAAAVIAAVVPAQARPLFQNTGPVQLAVNCEYWFGDTSMYMTPDRGEPIVYRMYKCGQRFQKSYQDLDGREWPVRKLLPAERGKLIQALEKMSGMPLPRAVLDNLESEIARIARERKLI